MSAPTTLVWELAGRPDPVASKAALLQERPGVCAVSGDECERTAPVAKGLGTSFTDQSIWRAPWSDRVGPGALWCCSGKGLETLRLWSIVAAPDVPPSHEKAYVSRPGLWLGNRADPTPIVRTLADPPDGPWLVSIAVSGQKHVLPYATVNHGPGAWSVRMETVTVTSDPQQWCTVHAAATELRRLGVSADDVLSGTPSASLKCASALDLWRTQSQILRPYIGSPVLQLALWTITKGTL